jgi:hypothetical protein
VNAQVKRASLECARDQINDDGVPWAGYRQVNNRRDPPAPGEWRPVVSADQAAAPLQVEAGLGLQRHDGVRGSAARTVADQCPSGSVDISQDCVDRDRREYPALAVDSADDGDSASIWTVALKRLAPRTARLMADWRSARSPENRPESGSALTVSDPLKGTRNESLRTVRNPRTTKPISRMSILLYGDPAPPTSG